MAGSKSDYLSNETLDHNLGTSAFTMPATPYLALFTAVTGLETNSPSAECAYGGYARKTVAFSAASGGSTSNSGDVTFNTVTSGSETITHWAVMDALTSGNVLYHGDFTTPKAVVTDDTPEVAAGDITITED